MSFLHRVAGLSLKYGEKFSHPVFGEELLLLHIERSQLRWFGHQVKMPTECLPGSCFEHVQLGEDHEADPGHTGENVSPGKQFSLWAAGQLCLGRRPIYINYSPPAGLQAFSVHLPHCLSPL